MKDTKKVKLSPVEQSAINQLHKAEERRKLRAKTTINLYSLRVADHLFGVPFPAFSDDLAIKACTEICPTANLYCLGSLNALEGRIIPLRSPRLILSK